jgi:hypothetical protein
MVGEGMGKRGEGDRRGKGKGKRSTSKRPPSCCCVCRLHKVYCRVWVEKRAGKAATASRDQRKGSLLGKVGHQSCFSVLITENW